MQIHPPMMDDTKKFATEMEFLKFNSVQKLNIITIDNITECLMDYSTLCVSVVGIAITLVFLYWLFYIPYNLEKHLDETGYEMALGRKRKLNSLQKKDAINRIRKSRKIGINELPPPYPNGWYSILESDAIKKEQATSVACLGENFVVYRTSTNEVHVLDAYCPHMGANMGVGGRVIGNNIECPFHKWSFSGIDGSFVEAPYMACAPRGSKVRKWISKEVNDNIFVWYHAEKRAEPWELPTVENIDNKTFVFNGRNEFYINCHIQEIPENGADLAHFGAVHRASILAGGNNPSNGFLGNIATHHWEASWKPSEIAKHTATTLLNHSVEFLKLFRFFEINVEGYQIGPSFVQLHLMFPAFGRMEILQTITPVEPLLQKIVHRFYGPRALAPLVKFFVIGESIMFQRDINIWNHKMFRNKPPLVKEDTAIKAFRNWYQQFYSENSKTYNEALDNYEW